MTGKLAPDTLVIPISYGSTEVIETGNWSLRKPQSLVGTPPCQEACPVGTDIALFLDFIRRGMYADALLTILRENPFPGVCGRVCFHPCEAACNRDPFDEAVSIQVLERFVSSVTSDQVRLHPAAVEDPREVAIVGSGPAGLACAYFLALLGHRPTVFEAKREPGGVMRWGIPQFRLPKTVLKKEIRRILALPVELKTRCRVGRNVAFEELNRFDAVFLSPGAELDALLSVEGEDLKGVCSGKEFLAQVNAGIKIDPAERTLVIGGGNTAMDVARSALRLDSRVTIAYRRTRDEMPAIREEIGEAEEEGIDLRFLIQPAKIRRTRGGRLEVVFQRMELGGPDPGGRPRPVPVQGEFLSLEADRVVSAVGEWIDLSWIPETLVRNGSVEGSSAAGIYAGGDAAFQPRTIASAIAAAKKAAISIDLFFRGMNDRETLLRIETGGKGSLSMEAYLKSREDGTWPDAREVVTSGRINTLYFEKSRRVKARKLGLEKRRRSFREVNLGVDAKRALLAASRCYSCGRCDACHHCYYYCPEGVISIDPDTRTRAVDYAHCKGCGACARSCPRNALFMKDLS